MKLFLDILNGPDGHNTEAEAELRKLIDKRRNRMHYEGRWRQEEDAYEEDEDGRTRKRRLGRRRRHNAQAGGDQVRLLNCIFNS